MIKDLKDLFVPYEQSLQLKELGFNERGFGFYELDELAISTWMNTNSYLEIDFEEGKPRITAPIFAQAFTFFREKYNLKSWVQELTNGNFLYQIRPHNLTDYKEGEVYAFEIHREAELACLIKLIEITKNKQ